MTWCNAELKHVERTENCWMCICSLSWWSYWVWNLCDFSFLKHESRPAPNTRPRFSSSVVEVFLFLFFVFLLWKPNSEHVAIFSVLCQLFSTPPPRLTPPSSVSLCVCVCVLYMLFVKSTVFLYLVVFNFSFAPFLWLPVTIKSKTRRRCTFFFTFSKCLFVWDLHSFKNKGYK